MKVRIVRRMPLATRTNFPPGFRRSPHPRFLRFLRWSRDAFLVAGVLALGYCGYVLLDSQYIVGTHMLQFGTIEIPRAEYKRRLRVALEIETTF